MPWHDAIALVDAAPPIDAPACVSELNCPPPDSNSLSLCGRLWDAETRETFAEPGATGAACAPDAPSSDGPCSLELRFFDALEFAASPSLARPLSADEIAIDDCGRFRAVNVDWPFAKLVAIVSDDAPAGASTTHVPTMLALETEMGEARTLILAPRIKQTTMDDWGTSFVDSGAIFFEFLHRNMLVSGVTPTRGVLPQPADTSCLADGRCFMTNSTMGTHSGTGAEPAGCQWPSELAASVPSVIWVLPLAAHVTDDPTTRCP